MGYPTEAEFAALGLPAAALDGFAGSVTDHLDSASGIIDSHLRGRYVLPLSQPYPPEIVQTACKIAAESLISIRGFDPEDGRNRNIRLRYDDAMAWLKQVAAGEVNLPLESDATPMVHDGGPRVRSRTRDTSARFR